MTTLTTFETSVVLSSKELRSLRWRSHSNRVLELCDILNEKFFFGGHSYDLNVPDSADWANVEWSYDDDADGSYRVTVSGDLVVS